MFKRIMTCLERNNNPSVRSNFSSDLPFDYIDHDAMDFFFCEAEKKIEATRVAIDSLNEKAKTYITFVSVGLGAMYSVLGFSIEEDRSTIEEMFLIPIIACSFCFLVALAFGFRVLGLCDVASVGNEPKDVMTPKYINQDNLGRQRVGILFRTSELYQTYINTNKEVISRKANFLRIMYILIWAGIAAFIAAFILL